MTDKSGYRPDLKKAALARMAALKRYVAWAMPCARRRCLLSRDAGSPASPPPLSIYQSTDSRYTKVKAGVVKPIPVKKGRGSA